MHEDVLSSALRLSSLAALSATILALWILILGPIVLTDEPEHRQFQVTGGISDWLVTGEAISNGSPYADVSGLADENLGWSDVRPDAPHPRPPSAIAALMPIRMLPFGSITLGLAVLSSMCLVVGVRLLLTAFRFSPHLVFLVAPLVGLSKPVIQGVAHATHVPFVLLGVALGLLYLKDRTILGGLGIGVATALKLFPGLLWIGLAVKRPRSLLVPGLVLLILFVLGVGFPAVGLSEAFEVMAASPDHFGARQFDLSLAANAPFFGSYSGIAWAASASFGMIFLAGRARWNDMWGIGTGLMVIGSPIAWPEYQILALPAVFAVWRMGTFGRMSAYCWITIMVLTLSGPVHFAGLLLVCLVLAFGIVSTASTEETAPRVDDLA